jgi:flagellar motor switch protein FliM
LVSADQQLYSEFVLALSEITHAIVFSVGTHPGVAVLEINLALVMGLVDLLVGGKGNVETSARKPTDVELAILEPLATMIFARLSASLRNVLPGEVKQLRHESSPEYIQATPPDAPVVVLTFDAKIGMASGIVNLCYTTPMVQAIQQELHGKSGRFDYYDKVSQEDISQRLLTALLETPVRVAATLGSTVVRAGDWFTIAPGDILVLDESCVAPATVSVEGQPLFRGHAGRVGRSLGVKISGAPERSATPQAGAPPTA